MVSFFLRQIFCECRNDRQRRRRASRLGLLRRRLPAVCRGRSAHRRTVCPPWLRLGTVANSGCGGPARVVAYRNARRDEAPAGGRSSGRRGRCLGGVVPRGLVAPTARLANAVAGAENTQPQCVSVDCPEPLLPWWQMRTAARKQRWFRSASCRLRLRAAPPHRLLAGDNGIARVAADVGARRSGSIRCEVAYAALRSWSVPNSFVGSPNCLPFRMGRHGREPLPAGHD